MAKNLLFVIDSIGGGGTGRIITYLVNNLDKSRFRISICLSVDSRVVYDIPQEIKLYDLRRISEPTGRNAMLSLLIRFVAIACNIPEFTAGLRSFIGAYSKVRNILENYYSASAALKEILEKENPDVIASFRTGSNIIVLITKLLFKIKRPVLCSHRNALSNAIKTLPHASLYKNLANFLYRKADLNIGVSDGVVKDLVANFKVLETKTVVIYNGVDINSVKSQSREPIGAEAEELFSDGNAFKIIAVGRLAEQKGHEYLLEAFKKVRREINCRLFIIGKGKRRKYLESLTSKLAIHEDVHLLGWQKNPFRFMARCDLFVLSSLWEGFANVIIEAMALGLPVISTDCPAGSSEILDGGRYGILVPIRDEDALAEAMLNVLTNGKLRMELSEKSRMRVQDFTIEKMLNDYENLFTEFMG